MDIPHDLSTYRASLKRADRLARAHRLVNTPAPGRLGLRRTSPLERLAMTVLLASIALTFGGCASTASVVDGANGGNIRTAADKSCMQKAMARIAALEWKSGRSNHPTLLAAAPAKSAPRSDAAAAAGASSASLGLVEHWVVSSKGQEVAYAVELSAPAPAVEIVEPEAQPEKLVYLFGPNPELQRTAAPIRLEMLPTTAATAPTTLVAVAGSRTLADVRPLMDVSGARSWP